MKGILSQLQEVNWDPGIVAFFLQSLLSAHWEPPGEIWEVIKNSYLFSCWGYLQNSLVIDIVMILLATLDVSPRVVPYDAGVDGNKHERRVFRYT